MYPICLTQNYTSPRFLLAMTESYFVIPATERKFPQENTYREVIWKFLILSFPRKRESKRILKKPPYYTFSHFCINMRPPSSLRAKRGNPEK
jgi:hypothetical protein